MCYTVLPLTFLYSLPKTYCYYSKYTADVVENMYGPAVTTFILG